MTQSEFENTKITPEANLDGIEEESYHFRNNLKKDVMSNNHFWSSKCVRNRTLKGGMSSQLLIFETTQNMVCIILLVTLKKRFLKK